MNRYFWLLMRFIGDEQTHEEREVVYGRARTALLQQLWEAEPSAARDSDLAFERLSFEEAVRTIEAGIARWGSHSEG